MRVSYATPPTNLGLGTLPVWYTEIESTAQTSGRLGNQPAYNSLDNLSFGIANPFGNR